MYMQRSSGTKKYTYMTMDAFFMRKSNRKYEWDEGGEMI